MRDVPEWIGKDDNAMPPASVFRRLYSAQDGRCPICTRYLVTRNITRDHIKPLGLGGPNIESNLQLICTDPCSINKSGEEVSVMSKADRWMDHKLGIKELRKRGWR